MARRQSVEEPKKGAPEFMSTYGDLVTLLLTFFVLLFSMSSIDAAKFKAFINSFDGSISVLSGGKTLDDGAQLANGISQLPDLEKYVEKTKREIQRESMEELEEIQNDFETYFEEHNLTGKIDVELNDNYVKLTFMDGVLFDTGKANLKPEAIESLNKVGKQLLMYPNNNIKIEGHTDNRPIHTAQFPSNWELSAARAIAVATYYIHHQGFDPSRFSAEGFGEYRPIATNTTPEGRAKNRRVEIKILSEYVSRGGMSASLN